MTAPAPEATSTEPAQGDATATDTANPDQASEQNLEYWKKRARQHEDAAKANKRAADELAALKKSQLTEQERAEQERKEREENLARTTAENMRLRAAVVHGISDENMDLLGSGTEEEVLARAERVGALEDLSTEVDQLKAENESLKAQLAAFTTPGPVPGLRPGTPGIPDSSYPTSWFPGLKKTRPGLNNTNNQ